VSPAREDEGKENDEESDIPVDEDRVRKRRGSFRSEDLPLMGITFSIARSKSENSHEMRSIPSIVVGIKSFLSLTLSVLVPSFKLNRLICDDDDET
jgi:hypothetical protein